MAHRATIIGAGFGGLLTATALREVFDDVVIVESDELPDRPAHRSDPIVERVFRVVRGIDGRYPEAKWIGLDPLPEEMPAMARAMGELACEDAEAGRAFRYAVQFFANEELMSQSLITKVLEWMGLGGRSRTRTRTRTRCRGSWGWPGRSPCPRSERRVLRSRY
jgi:hypothetical protein